MFYENFVGGFRLTYDLLYLGYKYCGSFWRVKPSTDSRVFQMWLIFVSASDWSRQWTPLFRFVPYLPFVSRIMLCKRWRTVDFKEKRPLRRCIQYWVRADIHYMLESNITLSIMTVLFASTSLSYCASPRCLSLRINICMCIKLPSDATTLWSTIEKWEYERYER